MKFNAETITGSELSQLIMNEVNTQFESQFKELFGFEANYQTKEQTVFDMATSHLQHYLTDDTGLTPFKLLGYYLTSPELEDIRKLEDQEQVKKYASIVKYIWHWNGVFIDTELI